jgi:hypothetical protein
MATILITWELGGGSGHLVPLQPVADGLARRGHTVFAAVRDVARAGRVFRGCPVQFIQAPFRFGPVAGEIRPPMTLAQILHNVGYGDESELFALAQAWRCLLEWVKPDLMICDHSPTALLASRGLTMRRVCLGFGFICPPDQHPLPNLRFWLKADPGRLLRHEDLVLDRMNRVLINLGQDPMDRVTRIYADVNATILTTFEELDHYAPRAGARYWGAWTRAEGKPPQWPPGTGPRIYGYLKNFPELPRLLDWLVNSGQSTIAYTDSLDPAVVERYRASNIQFENERLDMRLVAESCDVAILHGTHGTSAAMLMAGKPIMQLPIYLEQGLTAHAVCRLGAGLQAPVNESEVIIQGLTKVVSCGDFAAAARAVAKKYADFDPVEANERVLDRIEEVLA